MIIHWFVNTAFIIIDISCRKLNFLVVGNSSSSNHALCYFCSLYCSVLVFIRKSCCVWSFPIVVFRCDINDDATSFSIQSFVLHYRWKFLQDFSLDKSYILFIFFICFFYELFFFKGSLWNFDWGCKHFVSQRLHFVWLSSLFTISLLLT